MSSPTPFTSTVPPDAGQPKFILRGLDGLRAMAVAAVVIFHLWPTILPGGLIGVDLFFVISGYLITALLLREAAYTGKMHLPRFWVRRLRRLVPAMMVCLAVCSSVAWLIGGDVLVGLPRQVISALTYTTNWTGIAFGDDYFAQTSPELFTNFWSLAVEEQFYLAWPAVLVLTCMLIATWRRRRLIPLVLGLGSALTMAILLWSTGNTTRVYYGLDTHAFGLMLGACLALLVPWSMYPPRSADFLDALRHRHTGVVNFLRVVIGWASLIAIPFLAMSISEHHPDILFPWGLLSASLLGLGVIQALLPDVRGIAAEGLRRLLDLPPVAWIGKRSYGLYLWHWPLFVLSHYALGHLSDAMRGALVMAGTVVIAEISYHWIENPVRRYGFRGALGHLFGALERPGARRWAAACSLGVAGLCVTGAAVACVQAPELTEAEQVVAEGEQALNTPSPTPTPTKPARTGYVPTTGGKGVTMIGDSVTLASATSLQESLPGIVVDAKVSRNVQEGLEIARQQQQAGTLGRIVVISLSTNAAITPADVDQLEQIAESDQKRGIVLVTGQAPATLEWVATSNAEIKKAAAAHPNITIADWAAASDGHPELLVSDGVHPQPPGQQLYARTVSNAVDQAKKTLQKATADLLDPTDNKGN